VRSLRNSLLIDATWTRAPATDSGNRLSVAAANHEYRSGPITAVAESATNPRKRFDAKSLENSTPALG
jgi:hypothetical protein